MKKCCKAFDSWWDIACFARSILALWCETACAHQRAKIERANAARLSTHGGILPASPALSWLSGVKQPVPTSGAHHA
eukprot:CAMPEP_0177621224 /NCGR_PEP_ID=MMETSP0419_2-20121207/27451_1 /TAXON_ID=582737 /ORGANISM="Tetraselmis sp., Strain GSL018" /LENGTH=76 /DNA_ID=CAMNT_0019121087 /DNA_START=132 /DNA_END=362 /DNA_ORIENTATION=+